MDYITFGKLSEEKQKQFIREFLKSKNNKLNQEKIENTLTNYKYENKINYLSDVFIVPNIKNHIFTLKQENDDKLKFLNYQNAIDPHTRTYLNSLKRKFQEEKDYKEIYSKPTPNDKIEEKINQTFRKFYNETNEKIDYFQNYEFNDYLKYKYEKYNSVKLVDDSTKEIIFSKFLANYK